MTVEKNNKPLAQFYIEFLFYVFISILTASFLSALISNALSVPGPYFAALFEELARVLLVLIAIHKFNFRKKVIILIIGSSIGVLEITNAFFPENYATIESQNAPFLLLAFFEFFLVLFFMVH